MVVTDSESLDRVLGVRDALQALRHIICVDRADADGILNYQRLLADASDAFAPVVTAADDPALLIYTSATTGPPKGALHAHRVLLGHLPAIEFYYEYFPKPETVSGPRPTGPGLVGCTTCYFRVGTTA
jgi:acetyl-CoA synthetase